MKSSTQHFVKYHVELVLLQYKLPFRFSSARKTYHSYSFVYIRIEHIMRFSSVSPMDVREIYFDPAISVKSVTCIHPSEPKIILKRDRNGIEVLQPGQRTCVGRWDVDGDSLTGCKQCEFDIAFCFYFTRTISGIGSHAMLMISWTW